MATVLPFLLNRSDFDDETARLMDEAFDAECKDLETTPDSPPWSARLSPNAL